MKPQGRLVFVQFFGELKTPKRPLKLTDLKNTYFVLSSCKNTYLIDQIINQNLFFYRFPRFTERVVE